MTRNCFLLEKVKKKIILLEDTKVSFRYILKIYKFVG